MFDSGDAFGITSSHVQHGNRFTTLDLDNDKNSTGSCAERHRGGWWFYDCDNANLNGWYFEEADAHGADNKGMEWHTTWHNDNYSFKKAEMKIRPVV